MRSVYFHRARRLTVVVVVMALLALALQSRFRIANSPVKEHCLPYEVFVVDLYDTTPHRGGYFAFRTQGLAPIFEDGTPFIKEMAAVPGDAVDNDGATLRINGKVEGPVESDILRRTRRTPQDVVRHDTLPRDQYLMLGRLPKSYDGRYWGTIERQQLLGRAYPLW